MRNFSQTIILSALLLAAPLTFACDYPQRASVPDGATATKEEMINGQRDVKSYMAAMEEYLSCIEAAEQETVAGNELDEDARQQRIAMFNKKYNAAVDEMNLVAAEFNIQVRAYKERN